MRFFEQLLDTARFIVKKADMVLLALILAATGFGIVLIASATNYLGDSTQLRRVVIQAVAAVIGICLYFVFSNVDVEHFSEKWWLFLVFNLGFIALLLTPYGVDDGTGNRSWLYADWMPTSIQPAEVVKLSYTILMARQIAWFRENRRMRGWESLFWPVAHAGFMFVYIYAISSDAGNGLVYLMIYAGMACAAGLAWYWFAAGFGSLGAGIAVLALIDKLPTYMMKRFTVLFDHSFDPRGVGWQQTRSLMTIGSGGFFGQGLFNGIQTQSAYSHSLPERHTDLIFSVCGEELGMAGCLAIILLELLIVCRCLSTARMAKSAMGSMICIGFAAMLIFQTVENIGMCLFVMPVIGLTLPFFSYGGSSIVTLYAAMGIVSGVRSRSLPDWLRKT